MIGLGLEADIRALPSCYRILLPSALGIRHFPAQQPQRYAFEACIGATASATNRRILEVLAPFKDFRILAVIVLMPTNLIDVILLMVECRRAVAGLGNIKQHCYKSYGVHFQFEEE